MLLNNRIVTSKSITAPDLMALDIENFVQNLRNVTFRLQNEFNKYEGFDQWYGDKQELMKKDKDMVLFNNLRVKIVHQVQTAKSSTSLSLTKPITITTKKDEFTPIMPAMKFLGNGKFEVVDDGTFDMSNFKLEESYFFEERPGEDAIKLCTVQFLKLTKLVEECDFRFSSHGILNLQGIDFGKEGKYTEAIECFDKSIKKQPQFIEALINKGVAFQKLQKYSESISCFDKAIKIKENSKSYFNKSISLLNIGSKQEAKEAYDKAMELDPDLKNVSIESQF